MDDLRTAAAVIMAGGMGSRLGSPSKPLLRICGKTMLERSVAVARDLSKHVVVALSPHTISTVKALCPELNVDACIGLPGGGYPGDMLLIADIVRARPLLFLPADMPLLNPPRLMSFIEEAMAMDMGLVTLEAGDEGPLGISLLIRGFKPWRSVQQPWGPDLLNVNTADDLAEARRLCRTQHRP